MVDAKHTPGPWISIDTKQGTYRLEVQRTSGFDTHFALVRFTNLEDVGNDIANANLMAAAPDMLAALEYQQRAIKMLLKSRGQEARKHANMSFCIADVAINKAKGITE